MTEMTFKHEIFLARVATRSERLARDYLNSRSERAKRAFMRAAQKYDNYMIDKECSERAKSSRGAACAGGRAHTRDMRPRPHMQAHARGRARPRARARGTSDTFTKKYDVASAGLEPYVSLTIGRQRLRFGDRLRYGRSNIGMLTGTDASRRKAVIVSSMAGTLNMPVSACRAHHTTKGRGVVRNLRLSSARRPNSH